MKDGFCECGCGQKTIVSKYSYAARGRSRGQPLRFIHGHNSGRGPKSPSWKGGRSKHSEGYILVYCPEHPRANRGYVYEHILVMEEKVKRLLTKKEKVHHINRNRADNRPENLELCKSHAHHFVHHRKRTDLRLPDSENPMIICGCGCGSSLLGFDEHGRPRKYMPYHAPKILYHVLMPPRKKGRFC